jgi:hypothetical protein
MDRIVISINITIYQFPRLQVCPYLIKIGIKLSFSRPKRLHNCVSVRQIGSEIIEINISE